MVLDVTAEVGKTVKSAIKAKLTELGAYVDDELPDYIMILVGNKKTKDQMNDDLSLFLGHNTERFTSWLHYVLQKLNAASVLQKDAPKPEKEKEDGEKSAEKVPVTETEPVKAPEEKKKHKKKKDKSERKKEKKEKKKKKDKDKEKERHSKSHKKDKKAQEAAATAEEKKTETTADTKTAVVAPSEQLSKDAAADGNESPITDDPPAVNAADSSTVKPADSPADKEDDDLHDDIVDLRPDAEDLALGLEDEPVVKKIKLKTQVGENEGKEKPDSLLPNIPLRSIEIKVDNTNGREFSTKRIVSSPEKDDASPTVHDRLGPIPTKSTSPFSKRIINLREESSFPSSKEGEGMGRVVSNAIASAVKSVISASSKTDGKPSKKLEARVRPLPSSHVIVKEPEVDSVSPPMGIVVKRSLENATVRPLLSSQVVVEEEEEVDDVALPPVRVVSKVGAVLKRTHNSDDSDEGEQPSTKRLAGVASKVEVAPRPRRPGSMQANTALILRAVADAHKSVNKSVKRPLEEKGEERGRKDIYTKSYQERQSQRLNTGSRDAKTVKKFAITVPNSLLKNRMEVKLTDKQKQGLTQDSLIEMEDGEYISDEDGMKPEKVVVPQQKVSSKVLPMEVEDPSGSTRFIVTMDGYGNEVLTSTADLRSRLGAKAVATPIVDDEEFIEEIEEWEEDIEEMEGEPSQVGVAPQRIAVASTASATAPKWKTKIDASGLGTKKEERCRFWPACKEGTACQYIHPSKICNTFPNCRFADKCIYIHPNCKFDSACTKPNCPFTHASSRTIALAQASAVPQKSKMIGLPITKKKIICKFYPKCVDMNCVFFHPKQICRYGKACQTPSCIYIHPEVTTGSLLKWTAPKKPTSTSATAAPVSTATVAVSSTASAPTLTSITKPKAPISAV